MVGYPRFALVRKGVRGCILIWSSDKGGPPGRGATPRGSKRIQSSPREAAGHHKGDHKDAKEIQRVAQGVPKEIQGSLKGALRSSKRDSVPPRGAQMVQLSCPGGPREHFSRKCCKSDGRVARFYKNGNIG